MTDIRKRTGSKGVTYQVRYAMKGSETGYAYKTFETLKAARHFADNELPRHQGSRHAAIRTVDQAIDKWLEVCEFEGRQGKDAVAPATVEGYKYRAKMMKEYEWSKELHELEAPDIVAFRSWLLKKYSRDLSKKVLSSFHSALLEMVTQGVLAFDPAAQVSILQSRYREPVEIPTVDDVRDILRTADQLANHKNFWIAQAWERYRPMIYLAADTGMRPQEYLALPGGDLLEKGVRITQALDRSNKIGPTKSRAGRRYIPVGLDTLEMVQIYQRKNGEGDHKKLVFPGDHGSHQRYNNYLRRGWHILMEKAGMMEDQEKDGKRTAVPLYTPYSLRHFYASMLIAGNKDLKTIQERMGHEDAAMTLNVYGHLIRLRHAQESTEVSGILSGIINSGCGDSVANVG